MSEAQAVADTAQKREIKIEPKAQSAEIFPWALIVVRLELSVFYAAKLTLRSRPQVIELAFSILASDFAHLADEVSAAARGGGTIVHVDVMDGHFVPNITFGPPMVKALRTVTKLPLDCHMMVENPDDFIEAFAEDGANMMSVHQ